MSLVTLKTLRRLKRLERPKRLQRSTRLQRLNAKNMRNGQTRSLDQMIILSTSMFQTITLKKVGKKLLVTKSPKIINETLLKTRKFT